MEQENTFNEQEVKEQISLEVKQELSKMGYKLLNQDEVGGRDMVRLINTYKNKLIDHDKEVERINGRYKEEVAKSKLAVLEQDFRYDKQDFEQQIDKIIAEDNQRRLAEAEKLQADKEYKATRKETFEMLALLKQSNAEIPDDMFISFINPLVEAKDTKSIAIAKLLAGTDTNQYICDRAVQNITDYFNNEDLQNFGNSAKQFIATGEAELTLSLYMSRFEEMLRK